MRKPLEGVKGSERGITGLETAIILIAFVVVAAVFAFTVLSTGIFSSERSKETVYAGLEEARSTLEPRGSVIAYKGLMSEGTATIYKFTFLVSNALAGEPVNLTAPYTAGG
ncbi:MAG: archaellin/type IV pilin N-terminal domain-containing protein, partial [Dehalococcoidia bacterium]